MTIRSEKIFGAFQSKRYLRKIAAFQNINVTDEHDELLPKSDIIKLLSEDVRQVGFDRMLQVLTVKELKAMDELIPKEQDVKLGSGKGALSKRIKKYADEIGVEKFLNSVPTGVKKQILKTLDVEGDWKDLTDAILAESEAIGQEYYFSTFSIKQLKKFVESCGLNVDSLSQNLLVDCLMKQIDYKPPKKKKPPKPSKTKPDKIEEGITRVDLDTHFIKEELVEWCKERKLPTHGNKRDVIKVILAHVEGRPLPESKGKKKKRKGAKGKKSEKKKGASSKSESQSKDKTQK